MAVLAHSDAAELSRPPRRDRRCRAHENLREPENGLVMVRGRIGGDGAPFNLGEATVSRAAVRLATGEVGFGYTLGRDRREGADDRAVRRAGPVGPIRRLRGDERDGAAARGDTRRSASRKAAEAAATRVDFYTLVRGEG